MTVLVFDSDAHERDTGTRGAELLDRSPEARAWWKARTGSEWIVGTVPEWAPTRPDHEPPGCFDSCHCWDCCNSPFRVGTGKVRYGDFSDLIRAFDPDLFSRMMNEENLSEVT